MNLFLIYFYVFFAIFAWLGVLFFEYRPEFNFNIMDLVSASIFIAVSLVLCLLWPLVLALMGILAIVYALTHQKGDKK